MLVETQSPPFYSVPDFAELGWKGLAMAALFGGLLTTPWWVDSLALRGELKPLIPAYTVYCAADAEKGQPAEQECDRDSHAQAAFAH